MTKIEDRVRGALTARAQQIPYDVEAAWHQHCEPTRPRRRVALVAAVVPLFTVVGVGLGVGLSAFGGHRTIPAAPVTPDTTVPVPASELTRTVVGGTVVSPVVLVGHVSVNGVPSDLISWVIRPDSTESVAGHPVEPTARYVVLGTVPSATLSPLTSWTLAYNGHDKKRTAAGFQADGALYVGSRTGDLMVVGSVNNKVASVALKLHDATTLPTVIFGRASGFPATMFLAVLDSSAPPSSRELHYSVIARDVDGHVIGRDDVVSTWSPFPPAITPSTANGN